MRDKLLKMLSAKEEMKEKQFLMGNHSRGSRSIAGSRTLFSEKWRKENGVCSEEMNQKFDLEGNIPPTEVWVLG